MCFIESFVAMSSMPGRCEPSHTAPANGKRLRVKLGQRQSENMLSNATTTVDAAGLQFSLTEMDGLCMLYKNTRPI